MSTYTITDLFDTSFSIRVSGQVGSGSNLRFSDKIKLLLRCGSERARSISGVESLGLVKIIGATLC